MSIHEQDFSFKGLFVPLTTFKIIHFIIFIGSIVYFNSLFNGFVWDDGFQIVNNPYVQNGHFFYYFTHTIGPFYRPLMFFFYTLFYSIFGLNAFFYHLVQFILFIINGVLIFILFSHYSKNKIISFLLALLFVIHPINVESAVYIANLQDVLFVFFGLSALLIKIHRKFGKYTDIICGCLLLLGLFSKETGVLFVIMYVSYIIFFIKKEYLRNIFSPIIILITYILIRFFTVGFKFNNFNFIPPTVSAPFIQRLFGIPKIIYFYLKTLIYPDVLTDQYWIVKNISFSDFVYPLIIDILFFGIIIFLGIILLKRNRNIFNIFLYFFLWFCFGIGLHLQLIPLEKTAADRWFYFPMIGLFGIISLLPALVEKLIINKIVIKCFWCIFLIIILTLSYRTIKRNADWYNNLTLFSKDISLLDNIPDIQDNYGLALMADNRPKEAINHFQKANSLLPNNYIILYDLGKAYLINNEPDKANQTFSKAIDNKKDYDQAYRGLIISLLLQDKFEEASRTARIATKIWPDNSYFWEMLGISAYKLNDYNTAVNSLRKSLFIYPNPVVEQYLELMNKRQPILLNFKTNP